MTVDDDDIPARLANPYRTANSRSAVWGVTLGRVGAVTAGVIAVVAPADAPGALDAGADADGTRAVAAASEVFLGLGDDVHNELAEMSMPAGYLWPSPQPPDPPVSPALEL